MFPCVVHVLVSCCVLLGINPNPGTKTAEVSQRLDLHVISNRTGATTLFDNEDFSYVKQMLVAMLHRSLSEHERYGDR